MRRHSSHIHERFLRHIWSNQYLHQSALATTSGEPLRVLRPGELNLDGGPDFRNAKVRIGRTTFVGDVEIHRTVFDWIQHQHQEDPRYNRVILHVVLEADGTFPPTLVKSGRTVPLLVLGKFLNESLHSIWQKAIVDERARAAEAIPCAGKNENLPSSFLASWLDKLAIERTELKLRRFEERLRELALEHQLTVRESPRTWGEPPFEGEREEIPPLSEPTMRELSRKELWDQVLYEGMMDALGFSKNRGPFVRLARAARLKTIADFGLEGAGLRLEAFLFGVAGLIPSQRGIAEKETRDYVRLLRKEWKQLRPQYRGELLHEADWQFFPTRPVNFPTVRLGAAVVLIHKLLKEDLFRSIIQVVKTTQSARDHRQAMAQLLAVNTSAFWRSHYHFDRKTTRTLSPLGPARIHEAIINTIVPIALLYARVFKDKAVREGALALYYELPPAESNSVTRRMERDLFARRLSLNNSARQQAAIQLFGHYCRDRRCDECAVGRQITRN